VNEREAFIALNQVSGLGAITVKRMIEAFGSATAIFRVTERDLQRVAGIGAERARAFRRELDQVCAAGEMARAEEMGAQLLTWADATYPSLLKTIADPPLVLYVAGAIEPLAGPAIAIIGTRHPTVYGREMAQRLAFQLAGAGYVIVSGLALGIDAQAHRGAVQAKGRTIGVLGGALDCLYPKENAGLAKEMTVQGGAVLCEYPFGREPDRQTFPMRNRIVSGLVKGVVVVEAPHSSGTMITVDQALEQGRFVMAVPGKADSPASVGCHQLIRNGARLVSSGDEVMEELQELLPRTACKTAACAAAPERAPEPPASAEERKLLAHVGNEPVHIDALIRESGLPAGMVNAVVVGLQIKHRVKLLPGGLVKRV